MPNTISRALHDVGLSAWFGGTLANAVALNRAAGVAGSPSDSGSVTNEGWNRWTPVNAAAIGLHLAGSVGQLLGNKSRIATQSGAGTVTLVKTGLTVVALGITAWSRALGKKVNQHSGAPVQDGTSPHPATPPEVASAQKQLSALQWAVPAVTGALVVVSSLAGEQQRPTSVLAGAVQKITD
ncbi:hypothetical protein [Nakamurella endophytica]|uniref:ABC-type Mn/Zn transport systems, ATPase component n=1 Tax=Nakamurella endophytica TaxID=1748367 RepID=A0A917SUU0_9ACTN|nr:hypothetical protein [Nakamurella endophytica]GGL97168.1 hypothetical protein GCM10011594_16090 [Nakamurella endophytica]